MFTFNRKVRHFKKQIKRAEEALWVLEFRIYEAKEMREDRRRQRDRAAETVDALELQLKKDLKQEAKDELLKQKEEQQKYKDYVTKQVEGLDIEITGSEKNEEFPQGYQGIKQQMDALRSRIEMYKYHIKHNI